MLSLLISIQGVSVTLFDFSRVACGWTLIEPIYRMSPIGDIPLTPGPVEFSNQRTGKSWPEVPVSASFFWVDKKRRAPGLLPVPSLTLTSQDLGSTALAYPGFASELSEVPPA